MAMLPKCAFPEYGVNEKTRQWAKRRAIEIPRLANSILDGGGMEVGFIGQAICGLHMGTRKADCRSYHFDILQAEIGRVEVKTKHCSTPPLAKYNCSVACANDRQDCDAYAFMRVNYAHSVAWFMGWLPRDEFKARAFLLRQGEADPEDPSYKAPANCWNMRAGDLRQFIKVPQVVWVAPGRKPLELTQDYFSFMPKP